MKLPTALRSLSTLQLALGVSIALHAGLFSFRFIDPERFDRVFQDTPLEVILVNARANEQPDKAQAIAQTSLAGGGEADKGRASSPMPYSALTAVGDDFEERQRQIDSMQEQQTVLLTQLRKQVAALPPLDPREAAKQTKEQQAQQESASNWSSCWPRSKSASTRKTPAPRSAISARPRARPSTPSTTTACAARSRTRARKTSPSRPARSSTASWS